jgi:hypothetical protein
VIKKDLEDHWLLVPPDHTITRILLDATFTIQLAGNDAITEICIEVPFSVSFAGAHYQCDVSEPSSLVPMLGIFLKDIDTIRIYHSGVLQFEIDQQIRITVPIDMHYEAWNITSTNWSGVTCMPGGSVAFWWPSQANGLN